MNDRVLSKVAAIVISAHAALLLAGAAHAQNTDNYAAAPELMQALEWRNVGPYRGGRVTAVAGHPEQPLTYYLGATGGGVWKTANAGVSWENLSDDYFDTVTIGAITVAESDANIIYVGTGESPIRGVSTSHGNGVYKSVDGGGSWQHLGLDATSQISKIVVHPRDPDIVYVGAQGNPWAATPERGVYRSLDGGETFERVLFVDDDTGVSALSMDMTNPLIVYAAMWDHRRTPWDVESGGPGSGLYKTTDGGATWTELTEGLPELMGNTGISVSRANPDRVWAMIEAVEGGVYRSDDAGKTWKQVNDDPGIRDRGWYYTHIFADPVNENTVYVLAASMVRSVDGGVTFEGVATPHGDNHDLWINPKNNHWMVQGNDGGANVSLDHASSWSTQANQPTAQIYRVAVDNVFPYRLYGGQQDNSTLRIPSMTLDGGISNRHFRSVAGGESAQISFDADNPVLIYGTSLLGSISELNVDTEESRGIEPYPYFAGFRPASELRYRFNWNAPVLVSQHDPDVIYHGAQLILKSTDRGTSWTEASPDLTRNEPGRQGTTGGPIMIEGAGGEHYATLMYIAESPHDANTIWAGSDDGRVSVTRDGGTNWQDVTPSRMPEAQVNAIDVSPHDAGTAYIAVTRYKFNDRRPMLYRTSNYGRSWTMIVDGIGNEAFTRVVREDPDRRGLLYAGTEAGVYVSFNNGDDWQPLQLNLPPVPITDLKVHRQDLVAATQGRGFWILDDLTPLHQLDGNSDNPDFRLLAPRDAYRLDVSGWARRQAENPPNGAVFHYLLGNDTGGEKPGRLILEVLDVDGNVIRRFSDEAEKGGARGFVKGVIGEPPAPPLPTQRGLNRYVWNLRHDRYVTVGDTIRYVSTRPYRVAPGSYQVRLTLDGQSQMQSFDLAADPRHDQRTAEEWAQQQELLAELGGMVDEVHASTNELRAVADRVRTMIDLTADHPAAATIRERGEALISRAEQWEIHVPQPELPNDIQDRIAFPSRLLSTQILHVMRTVDQDPPVTEGSRLRARELGDQWAELEAEKRLIVDTGVRDFNELLRSEGVPHVAVTD